MTRAEEGNQTEASSIVGGIWTGYILMYSPTLQDGSTRGFPVVLDIIVWARLFLFCEGTRG